MKDLGPLQHFLGIGVTRSATGMFLSQRQYMFEILESTSMTGCKTCATVMDTQSKLSSSGEPVADPTLYRSLVSALQYLTYTRPDITLRCSISLPPHARSSGVTSHCREAHPSLSSMDF
jgi:hypothetical protein